MGKLDAVEKHLHHRRARTKSERKWLNEPTKRRSTYKLKQQWNSIFIVFDFETCSLFAQQIPRRV